MSDTDYIDMNAIFDDIECLALTTENAFVRRKFLKRMGLSVTPTAPGGEVAPAMGSQLAASRTSPHYASE